MWIDEPLKRSVELEEQKGGGEVVYQRIFVYIFFNIFFLLLFFFSFPLGCTSLESHTDKDWQITVMWLGLGILSDKLFFMLEMLSKYSSSHDLLENIFGSSRPWCGQYSEVLAFSHRENLACRYSPNIPFDWK